MPDWAQYLEANRPRFLEGVLPGWLAVEPVGVTSRAGAPRRDDAVLSVRARGPSMGPAGLPTVSRGSASPWPGGVGGRGGWVVV